MGSFLKTLNLNKILEWWSLEARHTAHEYPVSQKVSGFVQYQDGSEVFLRSWPSIAHV